jgi:hypothetical protein
MKQITNIASPEHVAVVDAIQLTGRVLEQDGVYNGNPDYEIVWKTSVKHVAAELGKGKGARSVHGTMRASI